MIETKMGRMQKSLETIYDEFIEGYIQGNFTEGVCQWNGDDALMSPRSFAHAFKKECESYGYKHDQYKEFADDLEEWCEIYLGNLEAKFA